MKRKILALFMVLIFTIGLTACGRGDIDGAENNVKYVHSKYMDMEIVEKNNGYDIYRDANTNVLYLVVHGYNSALMSPILNTDGTPKLYEE